MGADPRRRDRLSRLGASVRSRVTVLAALAVLLVLVATGLVLVGAHRRLLTSNVDEGLTQGAANLEGALVAGPVPRVLGGFGDDDTVAQVVRPGGEVLAATPNVAGLAPVAALPAGRAASLRTVEDLPNDGAEFRLLARRVGTPEGPLVIIVAGTLEDVNESVALLVASLTIAVPLVAALLGALVWWLVGRTLRPVETIRAEVAGMGGSDLHRRVLEPGTGDEIDRLAATMNSMLDRVEQAATRQQQFVADASHELRSPLARMRAELEVDLANPAGADPLATHRSVLEEAVALQQLVGDLLHLARSDAGPERTRRDTVDLDDIVLDHARRVRAGGRVQVDTTGVTAARVLGDRHQLQRAVANLVENAARHAATTVTFTLVERDGRAVMSVSDDGTGIPEGAHERVFDRFTRLDDARSTAAGGAGLGLAITRDIVERHGGTVLVDPQHRPGARFVLAFPH
ncbi:MAG: ATP-binding protein, partial [Acidimicrobiales bacterium]